MTCPIPSFESKFQVGDTSKRPPSSLLLIFSFGQHQDYLMMTSKSASSFIENFPYQNHHSSSSSSGHRHRHHYRHRPLSLSLSLPTIHQVPSTSDLAPLVRRDYDDMIYSCERRAPHSLLGKTNPTFPSWA